MPIGRSSGGRSFVYGDMNGDGAVNGADIDPFFACLGGNCVPCESGEEPRARVWGSDWDALKRVLGLAGSTCRIVRWISVGLLARSSAGSNGNSPANSS